MEALSRPPRRRETTSTVPLSRKLSTGHSFSASAKHAYDGVFAAPNRVPSSRSSGIDDYGEIFGGSRASSIPVLDLPSLDESEVLASRRSSKLDYSNIFGGFRNDDTALSYEKLFEKPSGAKKSSEEARAAAKGPLSSSSPEQLDKLKMSKENQQGSTEEASSEPVDGLKQFNMSYHKTSQRDIEIKNGTTHIAQMHSTPGYTCFIDERSSPPKKTVSGEYPKNSQSQPVQSKASPLSNLGASLVDKRRQHKRSVTADFKEVPKRNSSKDGFTDYSSSWSDDEEVDLNATAAASVAALKKALETAQASIRIAKEIMERKGGTQRFEVKKKREEKIPSGGNTKSLGNISKDSLKSGDVSEKDKAKLDNENYKIGSARKHEPASLNNQETDRRMKDRRTKEIPTTDDILELPNRATDVSEKDKAKLDSQNYKLGLARKQEALSLNNQEVDRRMKEIPTIDDVLELPNRATDVSEKDKAKLNNQNYKLGSARKHEAVSLNNQETDRRTKEIPTIDDILELPNRATDVSDKDKAKLDNESYKLGLARKLEAASLNNQETDRRTKEIPTTDAILELPNRNKNSLEEACKVAEVRNTPQDAVNEHYKSLDILELPNRNKNSLEEACKVAEVRNTLQDAVIVHYKSDDYIDNRPVAATHKTHELEDDNKVGIYLNDKKLKEKHKLETEESDAKRVCELEIARQLPDASNSPNNKSVASYKVHEEGEINKAEVSQDYIKMHKQEASPEKSEPEINFYLPTEESDKIRVCEEEVTKWTPNGLEDYSIGSSLIATYEVHAMERVSLNEEKMEDKQEASFRAGRCEAEINACLLLSEESDERRVAQATDKTEKNEKLQSEEAGCEKICEDPSQSEEMNNMAVPQADKESEENKKDFSRQEEYKQSAEIEESEEFTDEEVKPASNQMPKEIFKESIVIEESEVFTGEEVKAASKQMVPKEIFTPEILEKENIAVDSKDGIDDEELHENRLKATCELKGVWKNRYLSSWWGAISDTINTKGSNDNERDNNNEQESKSTGADGLKGVWKSRYLASEWGVNNEAFDVESKEKENNEIENGLENKLKGTTCELKGVWKTRYLASDWGAIKESSSVKEAEEVCQEDSLSDESERKGDNMNNENQLHKEYDAEESDTSVGDESDDVDESQSLFPKIHKFKETEIRHGDADHKVSTETETLDDALDASTSHLKAFQDETSSEENGSVSNVANEFVDQDNLEAAAKMEDRVNETYGCEKAEIQGKIDDGPPKDGFDEKQEDSDFSSSSRDDKSYESFSEDKETGPKIEESKESQKLLGVDGNKTKHGDEAKEVKEGQEEHVRRSAEMDQKTRDRIVVERAIREARERAFTEARERAERAAVERATAEVRQRAMAEAREKIEKASAASSKSSTGKASVEARLRAERAAVERATSEARERAREKVALSQRATSSREPAANNDQQGSDGNNGESAQRRKARQERHQRTMERAAKALAEKNQRDLKSQKEQAERNRFAETLDAEVKRWSSGKEGNLRALLSTLQYILGPDSGWQPVQLTEIISIAAVKKTYRRANLHVHPDKLQQRGASIQQKYICEKVFDLLKAAWNKFNSEER